MSRAPRNELEHHQHAELNQHLMSFLGFSRATLSRPARNYESGRRICSKVHLAPIESIVWKSVFCSVV